MARVARSLLCMGFFAAAIVAIGCSKDNAKDNSSAERPKTGGPGGPPGMGPGGPGGPPGGMGPGGPGAKPIEETGEFAAGKKVYNAQDCSKCHSVDANTKRGNAPNLGTVGKEHNAEWIAAHIKNPKTHSPMSRMPAYDGKISDADLKALSEFLASLK